MPPLLMFWVKWETLPQPEKFVGKNLDEFYHWLRECLLREHKIPEWVIRTYD